MVHRCHKGESKRKYVAGIDMKTVELRAAPAQETSPCSPSPGAPTPSACQPATAPRSLDEFRHAWARGRFQTGAGVVPAEIMTLGFLGYHKMSLSHVPSHYYSMQVCAWSCALEQVHAQDCQISTRGSERADRSSRYISTSIRDHQILEIRSVLALCLKHRFVASLGLVSPSIVYCGRLRRRPDQSCDGTCWQTSRFPMFAQEPGISVNPRGLTLALLRWSSWGQCDVTCATAMSNHRRK